MRDSTAGVHSENTSRFSTALNQSAPAEFPVHDNQLDQANILTNPIQNYETRQKNNFL